MTLENSKLWWRAKKWNRKQVPDREADPCRAWEESMPSKYGSEHFRQTPLQGGELPTWLLSFAGMSETLPSLAHGRGLTDSERKTTPAPRSLQTVASRAARGIRQAVAKPLVTDFKVRLLESKALLRFFVNRPEERCCSRRLTCHAGTELGNRKFRCRFPEAWQCGPGWKALSQPPGPLLSPLPLHGPGRRGRIACHFLHEAAALIENLGGLAYLFSWNAAGYIFTAFFSAVRRFNFKLQ